MLTVARLERRTSILNTLTPTAHSSVCDLHFATSCFCDSRIFPPTRSRAPSAASVLGFVGFRKGVKLWSALAPIQSNRQTDETSGSFQPICSSSSTPARHPDALLLDQLSLPLSLSQLALPARTSLAYYYLVTIVCRFKLL
jgi:hypothetical protein